MGSEQQYLDLLRDHRALLDEGSPAALCARRDEAAAAFAAHGLPTQRVERYKYCDVPAAFAPDYGVNLRRAVPTESPYATYRCAVPNLSTALFYVVGDVPVIDEAKAALLPEGVVVCSLRQAEAKIPHFIEDFYHRAASRDYDGVATLNTMLAQDGLLVYIPDGVRVKTPLQIVNIAAATEPLLSIRRVLVVVGKGSAATLLFCEHTAGNVPYLSTQVTEVFADEMAEIGLYTIEETAENNTSFSNLYVEQQAGSNVTVNGVVLTCGQSRTTMDFRLVGRDASVMANGAVIADGEQRVDNNILVSHEAEGGKSDLLYKYVLNGKSVGAYAGKVYVAEGAQQTASEQTNANLCASPTAHAYAQPMLEIYADDVRCNHGSSIGKLDEIALFYMRQRGIPEAEARLLLQHAFINDVLRRISIDHLRERLSHLVEQRFRGSLSQCRDCSLCQ